MTSMNDNFVGPERSLMVKATLLKRLRNERRLCNSELRFLDRQTQTGEVRQRKDFLSKKIHGLETEIIELEEELRRMLSSPTDQLNRAGKFYVMAEKMVKA